MSSQTNNVAPDKTLLNYIQTQWSETTRGITKNDIMFTDKDENTEDGAFQPHIIVQQAGARRIQQEIDDLYEYTFMIKVKLWNRWNKIPREGDKKYLHWLMVNHVKRMFSITENKHPTGWEHAYVSDVANTALAFDLLVNLNEYVLTVKALAPWV
jgi:hypothetical protein